MGTEPSLRPVFSQQLILSPLFTGVRGREILGSSAVLAGFSTMSATAPVGSVQERRKRHDLCGRTSRQQGEGAPPIRGGLRWGQRPGHRRVTPLRVRLPSYVHHSPTPAQRYKQEEGRRGVREDGDPAIRGLYRLGLGLPTPLRALFHRPLGDTTST